MIRRPPRSTQSRSSAASDVYKRQFLDYVTNSLVVAAIAAGACVLLALAMGHGLRLGGGRVVRSAAQLTTFGYAVPGVVVGLGVLIAFAALDDGLEAAGVPC